MWSFQQSIDELHKIFHFLNDKVFQNELPLPTITIQSRGKRNALGWCSQNPIWLNQEETDKRHEINICAENANMKVIDILEIMLHEMCHYYADLHSIKTTSRGGNFHNKKFKEIAEKFGLIVVKTQKYGYADTKLSKDMMQLAEDNKFDQEAFQLYRINDEGLISKKRGSIKHTCPDCGAMARSTKEILLICGKCQSEMENDADEMEDS